MRIDKRLTWLFLAEVAEEVEDCNSPADAVARPVFGAVVATIMWLGVLNVRSYTFGSGYLELGMTAFASVFAVAFTAYFAVGVCAAVVYYRQETELPVIGGNYDERA